ncbi:hemolysin, lipoprotein [Legionella gratiana]|uniref:Hemolysin, lipoprotein n=1 Tax=Legionella gratiana TaxID=45066 RepID=A0A378JI29_9GAMM|nr:BON domain-containing protein [Legionella gratiana]KTD11841.1 hemolysin, lipoprotein [Legionella gratiana]STX46568.1 hemolysin, lipoprotein [Legionella gratiana]
MLKQGRLILFIVGILLLLSGCISGLWTGATLVYDRHDVYKKLDDYSLFLKVNNAIMADNLFKNNQCVIDIAVFKGDILLVGHVPTPEMKKELRRRLAAVKGYRRLFNYVGVNSLLSNSMEDSWITTKIRSQIFADGSIDPNAFKVVTSDRVVYLMGDVHGDQAVKVINISRTTADVVRVVKLLQYFTYQKNQLV